MSGFFDPKEEVIEIELTQYGKYMLSRGELNPVYYAFYDDDILYDPHYAGHWETQNAAIERIRDDNTPRLKVQSAFDGIETSINEIYEPLKEGKRAKIIQGTKDKHYALMSPIGNSALNSKFVPAISFDLLNGELISATNVFSSSFAPQAAIPQLSSSITYDVSIEKNMNHNEMSDKIVLEGLRGEIDPATKSRYIVGPFEDNSYIRVDGDFILVELLEKNSVFEKENFDIEVYEIEDYGSKLIFAPLKYSQTGLKREQVNTYINIFVDSEIDDRIMCRYVKEDNRKGIFMRQIYKCGEEVPVEIDVPTLFDDNDGETC